MNKLKALICRDAGVCYTEIQDEIVILNPEDEHLYRLNTTAAELWRALDTPKTIAQLSDVLAQTYQGESNFYEQDVLAWVDMTQKKGLLTITKAIE